MAKAGKKKKLFNPWFLREWRNYKGHSVEKLAEMVGMSGASISRMENRTQPYQQESLEKLADALECKPADLIGRPPGPDDIFLDTYRGLDEPSQKRALIVLKALKDSEAA